MEIEKYVVIDLRQAIGSLAGLTDAERVAMYKKFRVDELGPYRRITSQYWAELQSLWQAQVARN